MQNRKAFTMVELVFVIVVIGILSAVAIPKLAATRDDAEISKARSTLASVRNSIATERQKRILRGDFLPINSLNTAANTFDLFNPDAQVPPQTPRVLEYPVASCATRGVATSCWSGGGVNYTYTTYDGRAINFLLNANRFGCTSGFALCRLLE